MDYEKIRVPYQGRREFGTEGGDGIAIASSIISKYFGGSGGAGGFGGTETGGSGTGYGGDENRGGNSSSFYAYLSKTSMTYSGPSEDVIFVYGFKDMEQTQTFIGDLSNSAATINPCDIEGIPSWMTVEVEGNGTTATTITVTATGTPESAGTLIIPVNININGNPIDPYHYTWSQNINKVKSINLTYSWSIDMSASGTTGLDGKSAWYMTLSNDNASINCDSDGNILSGAVRPAPCEVKIFYGDDRRLDATYVVSSNTPYTGITTATSNTGVLTITCSAGTMNWEGSLLQLTISGSSSGEVRDIKTMNISKVIGGKAGEDGTSGAPATSYWLVPSFTEIIYDVNTHSANPKTITCKKYMQVGQDTPKSGSDVTADIYYTFQSRRFDVWDIEQPYPSTGISITSGICENSRRLRFILKSGTTQYDLEDVDIIKDGLNGTDGRDGQDGRQGAAIRGPYNYYDYSASTQCWCGGNSGTTPCEDCSKWIDVIIKDGMYLYCNSSYWGTIDDGISANPSKWTSGASFDFVATNLLLASAASINFLSNNELYLGWTDSGGTYHITGGAKGAEGGSGVTFWAGNEEPELSPFRVYADGTIQANNGVFGGYIQMKYVDMTDLESTGAQHATERTYYLDKRAYVIIHTVNGGGANTIYLPTPTSAWNGFMYSILSIGPSIGNYTTTESVAGIIKVSGDTESIIDYVYRPYGTRGFSQAHLYGGKYQFVCAEIGNGFNWLLTEATGGAKLYGTTNKAQGETNWRCFRPVFGYEDVNGTPQIKNIRTGSGDDSNTMYIQMP